EFFKKKRACLISQDRLAQFQPAASTLTVGTDSYALDPADGCVLKRDAGGWRAWMGLAKSATFTLPFPDKGLVITAD
ncbi:hypothetical protein ABTE28_20895, partial [Acinetobacter baumannii]